MKVDERSRDEKRHDDFNDQSTGYESTTSPKRSPSNRQGNEETNELGSTTLEGRGDSRAKVLIVAWKCSSPTGVVLETGGGIAWWSRARRSSSLEGMASAEWGVEIERAKAKRLISSRWRLTTAFEGLSVDEEDGTDRSELSLWRMRFNEIREGTFQGERGLPLFISIDCSSSLFSLLSVFLD